MAEPVPPEDWEALADYVGASDVEADFVEACWDLATALVLKELGEDEIEGEESAGVPQVAVDQATLLCGSELYHRKNAPNGIAQFTTPDGTPIRVARDPMVAARPILAPFLTGGFA